MTASSDAGRIGVWGRSGSGKSAYTKRRIKSERRVIVFDPLGEYGAEGFKVIEHRAGGLDAVRLAMRDNWQSFRLAYVPPAGREPVALSALCKMLLKAQTAFFDGRSKAQICLVVEEMNLSFSLSGGVARAPGFAEICSRGRHYGIEVIGVSQRIAEVATRFRGNCTETIVFRQKGPRDVAAAAAELGTKEARITALRNLQYLAEKDGEITAGALTFKAPAPAPAPANQNRKPAPAAANQNREPKTGKFAKRKIAM
jgi:hypothetical protein